VIFKDLFARFAQLGLVLLQTLRNGEVIAQLLSTETLSVRSARSLLFGRTHVALGKSRPDRRQKQECYDDSQAHANPLVA
jgi:hypothetical protein